MRLFHVSEDGTIDKFIPRIPYRSDMDKSKGLVWALTEPPIPHWLTPRDCPRIGFRTKDDTAPEDIDRFFSSSSRHCVAIEHGWHKKMSQTTLYLYEFDPANFYWDDIANFYVSDQTVTPIGMTKYDDLFEELFNRDIEVRILNNLWSLAEALQGSTLHVSLCRMGNAKPKPEIE